jgi:DNA-binding CsgD family transcriptional regulator/PAS domain-containing protein
MVALGRLGMTQGDHADFLDRLYDAALDPSLWRSTIAQFADMIGGDAGWLSQLDITTGDGLREEDPMSRIDPQWADRYAEHFAQRNPLLKTDDPREFARRWELRILTDEDWMPKEELVRTEFYNDFWRPQDIDSALMVRLDMTGMEVASLNVSRPKRRGQFDKADLEIARQLHPHLIRAFRLGRKMAQVNRVSGELASVLDLSPHGLFLVGERGHVRHVNRAGEAILAARDGLCIASGRLGAANGHQCKQLHGLIAAAGARDGERRSGGTMALPLPDRALPLSITVAPVTSERYSPFHEGRCVLVCVTDLNAGTSLPGQKLRELFGLTGAEARVAVALFEGLSPRETADRHGISPNTVHIHLARIFEKTGTNRQTELARLMMRVVGAFPG